VKQPKPVPARKRREPWHPAEWAIEDAQALQALSRGSAAPGEQMRALKWIIEQAAMTYDEPFVPGEEATRSYLMGRMSVGRQIVKLIKVPLDMV
jgi:hypothetical protein